MRHSKSISLPALLFVVLATTQATAGAPSDALWRTHPVPTEEEAGLWLVDPTDFADSATSDTLDPSSPLHGGNRAFSLAPLACGIDDIRLGGQPGDAYVGPTCNNDDTYRTCFYVSGTDLPADNPSYEIELDGVVYPVAFTVQLSPTEVVVCATGLPQPATGVDVRIQLEPGCEGNAPDLYDAPNCSCTIDDIRTGGQLGDAYVGPTCNADETYRTCFYVTGGFLPGENPDYQLELDGVLYPVAFTVQLGPGEVVLCATGLPDQVSDVDVRVQLESGCELEVLDLYDAPNCSCTIDDIRIGGAAGDAYVGPTCNNNGTYRTCFYATGVFLPAENPNYLIELDGVAYPVAFTVQLSPQTVVVCATNLPYGVMGVDVHIELDTDCTGDAIDLYDAPPFCPGGFCGDLIVQPALGEMCDDGNNDDLDGCSSECLNEGACCTNGPMTRSDCIYTTQPDCEANHSLYLGNGSVCTDDIQCETLVVTMDSLSAVASTDGVLVRWITLAEIDTAGFRVLRESIGRNREKRLDVVQQVPAAGNSLAGASYEVLDRSRAAARAVAYYIEDIDLFGRVTRHGPIAVDRGVRQGPTSAPIRQH